MTGVLIDAIAGDSMAVAGTSTSVRAMAIVAAIYAAFGMLGAIAAARSAPLFAIVLGVFSVTGATTSRGLLRSRHWAPGALLFFGFAGGFTGLAMFPMAAPAQRHDVAIAIAFGSVVWLVACWLAAWHVRRYLARSQ